MSAARERILEARIAELETEIGQLHRGAREENEVQGLRAPETGPVLPGPMAPDPGEMVPKVSRVEEWALALWRNKIGRQSNREPDEAGLVSFLQRNLRRRLK